MVVGGGVKFYTYSLSHAECGVQKRIGVVLTQELEVLGKLKRWAHQKFPSFKDTFHRSRRGFGFLLITH